jgi:hypothetical protein
MARTPHLPQILQGPLAARPAGAQTPDWVWYFAWDDNGGAFYRPTAEGWVKATPSVEPSPWQGTPLAKSWSLIPDAPLQFRRYSDMVEMRGGVRRSAGAFPSEIATLPSGFCPPAEVRVPVVASQTISHISVATSGVITVYEPIPPAGGPSQKIYFDGVRFSSSK